MEQLYFIIIASEGVVVAGAYYDCVLMQKLYKIEFKGYRFSACACAKR